MEEGEAESRVNGFQSLNNQDNDSTSSGAEETGGGVGVRWPQGCDWNQNSEPLDQAPPKSMTSDSGLGHALLP